MLLRASWWSGNSRLLEPASFKIWEAEAVSRGDLVDRSQHKLVYLEPTTGADTAVVL